MNNYLEVAAEVYHVYQRKKYCTNLTWHGSDVLNETRKAIMASRSVFYNYTNFSWFYFFLFEYYFLSVRLVWTISPVIVLAFALNISIKFDQFNERLNDTPVQLLTKSLWREFYEHYMIICNLLDRANDMMSPLIVPLTFFDFFFSCERIYRNFSEEYGVFDRMNLVAVTFFILIRCYIFLLICSDVNHNAFKPLEYLRNVPEGRQCEDVS